MNIKLSIAEIIFPHTILQIKNKNIPKDANAQPIAFDLLILSDIMLVVRNKPAPTNIAAKILIAIILRKFFVS